MGGRVGDGLEYRVGHDGIGKDKVKSTAQDRVGLYRIRKGGN